MPATPNTYSGCTFWYSPAYTARSYTGSVAGGVHPTADGDLVRTHVDAVSGLVTRSISDLDANRCTLRNDGTRVGHEHSANTKSMQSVSLGTLFKHFWESGSVGTVMLWVKFLDTSAAATQYLVGCGGINGTDRGWSVYRNTSTQIGFIMTKGVAPFSLSIVSTPTITDNTTWHCIKASVSPTASASTLTIDSNSANTGSVAATASGSASFELKIGETPNANTNNARAVIGDIAVFNVTITDADQRWIDFKAFNPPLGGYPIFQKRCILV